MRNPCKMALCRDKIKISIGIYQEKTSLWSLSFPQKNCRPPSIKFGRDCIMRLWLLFLQAKQNKTLVYALHTKRV